MPLDEIAKRILQALADGPLSADSIAARCTGGATRMTSPRLVWLEGLGLIENTGAGSFGITSVGQNFLETLD
jgi:hypothetical protein